MLNLRDSLWTGVILRPLQMIAVIYMGRLQWHELRHRTVWQRIKEYLFLLLVVNFILYTFSLFIDLVGLFGWLKSMQLDLLSLYLYSNTLSATFVTVAWLMIYRINIRDN